MAEYGVRATELAGPSGAGSNPIAPVRNPSQQFNNIWMEAARPLARMATASDNDPLLAPLNEYAIGMDKLNQMRLTGDMNPATFNRERQRLWSTIQANNPGVPPALLQREMAKQYTSANEASGMDEGVQEAKRQRDQENEIAGEGVKLGMWDTNFANNPETRPMALNLMNTYRDGERRIKLAGEAYETTRRQVDNGQKDKLFQQGQEKLQLEREAKDFFVKTTTASAPILGSLMEKTIADVKAGKLNGEDAITAFSSQLNSFRSSALAGLVNDPNSQAKVDAFFDDHMEQMRYAVDPKNITEFTSERNKLQIAQRQAAIQSDYPLTQTLAGLRNLVGDTAMGQVASLGASIEVINNLVEVANTGNTKIVQNNNKDAQKITFNTLDTATAALVAGTSRNAAVDTAVVEANTKAILKDFSRIQQGDAVKLNETVRFLAGPTIKHQIEKGTLGPAELATAGEVYKGLVRGEVMSAQSRLLQTSIINGSVKGARGENISLAEVVDFKVDDNGVVSVVSTWDDKTFGGAYSSAVRAQQSLNELNRQLSGLNNAIRVGAHIDGRTDYKKFFEENKAAFLPSFTPSPQVIEEAKKNGYKYLGGNHHNPRSWVKTGTAND